jgi:hypothetical protein
MSQGFKEIPLYARFIIPVLYSIIVTNVIIKIFSVMNGKRECGFIFEK